MRLTEHLPLPERETVEARLRSNLMAWFTTVDPSGRPTSVPVWFLLQGDETILIYTQAGTRKLRSLAQNPHVAFGLDVTDIGRSNIRIAGDADVRSDLGPADQNPAYTTKYLERIGALFGTPRDFAAKLTVPLVIKPERLMTGP